MRNARPRVVRLLPIATVLFAWGPAAPAGQSLADAPPPASAVQPAVPRNPTLAATGQQAAPENSGRRTVVATRLAAGESIRLDGRLDEAVWSRAVPAGDFVQIDPGNGRPATEKTDVRITFDADALYVGVICYDSESDGWIAYQRRRDEFLQADDKFQWTIDTFLDARSGYFFETNPLGAMADALLGVNGQNRVARPAAFRPLCDARPAARIENPLHLPLLAVYH